MTMTEHTYFSKRWSHLDSLLIKAVMNHGSCGFTLGSIFFLIESSKVNEPIEYSGTLAL